MSFEYLEYLAEKNRFDEMQIIGRTVESPQGRSYYFLAMVRKEDQVQICILAQTEPWADKLKTEPDTVRQSMKSSFLCESATNISKITINDQVLEIGGGEFGKLDAGSPECMTFMTKLADAGWSMPEDNVFYQMDWDSIELMKADVRAPLDRFPDWEDARVRITWGQQVKGYCVEKRLMLVPDGQKAEEGQAGCSREIPFTITDKDGTVRDAVCYLNSVKLIDMWEEYEKQLADPEYQRQVREHISEEEFENIKQMMYRALEQECPRGMCFFSIEYECDCEADLSLQFFAREYLESQPVVHHGSATVFLSNPKPDKELGDHGLKLHASILHTPVAPDTKELWAELFSAHKIIPEREEDIAWT